MCDSKGVIYAGRETPMEENKARYARETTARTLADAIAGADIFLGLSGPQGADAGHGQAAWPPIR